MCVLLVDAITDPIQCRRYANAPGSAQRRPGYHLPIERERERESDSRATLTFAASESLLCPPVVASAVWPAWWKFWRNVIRSLRASRAQVGRLFSYELTQAAAVRLALSKQPLPGRPITPATSEQPSAQREKQTRTESERKVEGNLQNKFKRAPIDSAEERDHKHCWHKLATRFRSTAEPSAGQSAIICNGEPGETRNAKAPMSIGHGCGHLCVCATRKQPGEPLCAAYHHQSAVWPINRSLCL